MSHCVLRKIVAWVVAAAICGCGSPSPETELTSARESYNDKARESPSAEVQSVEKASAPVGIAGPPRQNKFLRLAVTDGGFATAGPDAPVGLRNYTVALRGASRSRNDVEIEIGPFVFAQNESGCISRPLKNASWLSQPFDDALTFSGGPPTEGQLAFQVPVETQRIRLLIVPAEGALIVPVGDDFEPSWPEPIQTIEDGSTLRVLVLPPVVPPETIGAPPAGRMHAVFDFVIMNLKDTQGIEFTTSQQLRLIDSQGVFIQPSLLTQKIGCRLDDGDVIPPAHARRFSLVYEIPAGTPMRLQYRGFEVDETTVDLNRSPT